MFYFGRGKHSFFLKDRKPVLYKEGKNFLKNGILQISRQLVYLFAAPFHSISTAMATGVEKDGRGTTDFTAHEFT